MVLSVDWSYDSAYIACGTSRSRTLILDSATGSTIDNLSIIYPNV
jgi:hypothetical protein